MVTGRNGEYGWLVVPESITDIPLVTVRGHQGLHLCIASYDSGTLQLNEKNMQLGWVGQGEVSVSPALTANLSIPAAGWDEWYVVERPKFDGRSLERFVNYGGFTQLRRLYTGFARGIRPGA